MVKKSAYGIDIKHLKVKCVGVSGAQMEKNIDDYIFIHLCFHLPWNEPFISLEVERSSVTVHYVST